MAVRAARRTLPVRSLWAGVAGAGAEASRDAVQAELERAGLAERVTVGTDVQAAFHDAFSDGPGVLLVAGTGSIAWARDGTGAVCRVGGWGALLGDEGSGYAVGLAGLRAVVRARDGRGPPTALSTSLSTHCGATSGHDLADWAARSTKAGIAGLAPLVVQAADAGDVVGTEIIERAVSDLVAHVRVVRSRCDQGPSLEVMLWGGLVAPGGPLRGRTVAALREAGVEVGSGTLDAVMGAARLAVASSLV